MNPALNLLILFKITETKMNLARMMHVLEKAITKTTFVRNRISTE